MSVRDEDDVYEAFPCDDARHAPMVTERDWLTGDDLAWECRWCSTPCDWNGFEVAW